MSNEIKVPVLQKSALVTITLGSRIITDIQGALAYMVEGKSQQELQAIKEHITAGTLTPWESSCVALTRLLQVIYDAAKENGMLDYRSLEDTLKS